MAGELSGQVALITGASQGIGSALALGFAAAGAAVGVHCHSHRDEAAAVTAEIRRLGGRAETFAADLRDAAQARDLVSQTVAAFGRLDALVNNAGITSWGAFLDYPVDAFDDVVGTNLRGSYFCSQAAAQHLRDRGTPGRILFISSLAGVNAMPYLSAYSMTKAALRMLARSLALELGPLQITVNAIGVGPTLNERNLRDDPEYDAHWGQVVPLGRAATPADTVAAAIFLCSPAASYVTGATLMVDGGWSAYGPTPRFDFVDQTAAR